MTEQLMWNATVRVDGGPQLAGSDVAAVDAYTKLSPEVPKNGELTVGLGSADDGEIVCLVIVPARLSKELTFKVGGKTMSLDQPLFLFGGGAKLVGNQAQLTIKNDDAEAAAVQILVGRRKPRAEAAPAKKAQPAKAPPKAPPKAPAKKAPAKKAPPPPP